MTASTSRDSDKFMLRFPDGMRDRIREAAAANNRSMNAEIIARLEASFVPKVSNEPLTPELFDRLFGKIELLEEKLDKLQKKRG